VGKYFHPTEEHGITSARPLDLLGRCNYVFLQTHNRRREC
jgi:hypothetical protein